MPEADGKLTQAEKETVKNWLLKWNMAPCPICGQRNWMIADHLVQPITIGPNRSLQLSGTGYPQVMVISNDCGYTRFLNAVVIGIVKNDPPPKEVKK